MGTVDPTNQSARPHCSLPMRDADLALGNANWTKGLQAASDWIWSANLNPEAFPNNLGRFFLHTPGVFEQQLNYSTTLIFDLPSFRNGIQVSGFIDRVTRELVISYVAQRRRAWYSMTHHAILGRLTSLQAGMSEESFGLKWSNLLDFDKRADVYSELETQVLHFAAAFTTDPKTYTDEQYDRLRSALGESVRQRYSQEAQWLEQLGAARKARVRGVAAGERGSVLNQRIEQSAADVDAEPGARYLEEQVNAAVVELSFLCLQFTALACVFTGLNIPDEEFLPGVTKALIPDSVIERINTLCEMGGKGLTGLVPPTVELDLPAITSGEVIVAPAALRGCRVPMTNYEVGYRDRDCGVTVGGVQVGVYGWGLGSHFPGSLPYLLMHHPELARFEAPYSLPLLFNEDEWRNGVQTSGFVSRLVKEFVIQKVYRTIRSRYGLEHHTMFFYNAVADEYGVGRWPAHDEAAVPAIREKAHARAKAICLHMHNPDEAPGGTFSESDRALMDWIDALLRTPHNAHSKETQLRTCLDAENRVQVARGDRRLDRSGTVGDEYAFARLLDHQIAELAMIVGHMDGLGRVMTILQLPAEPAVVVSDGYFQSRPAFHDVLTYVGVDAAVLTLNELTLNPKLGHRLKDAGKKVVISADDAAQTGEY